MQLQQWNGGQIQQRPDTAISRTNAKFIIGGDLNAKHELWNNNQRNQNGRLLFDHAQLGHYTVQFSEDATFVSRGFPDRRWIFFSPTSRFQNQWLSTNLHPIISLWFVKPEEAQPPFRSSCGRTINMLTGGSSAEW